MSPSFSNPFKTSTGSSSPPKPSDPSNRADPRAAAPHEGATSTSKHVAGGGGVPHSTSPAPNTAGPHSKDILNKLDPRVDSDSNRSQSFAQKTHAQPDPHDASQVPPSVFQRYYGEPRIAPGNRSNNRARRNSAATAQESMCGI